MSVRQARELICDCRNPVCVAKNGEGADRCGYAITDYADTHAEIRVIGARMGWTWQTHWPNRDFCPTCTAHGGSPVMVTAHDG